MSFVPTWKLRADFAITLAETYGKEVPAYNTLVEVSEEVNRDFMENQGAAAERLGSISRVTAERHGAIRVGSAKEMAEVSTVFGAFGMYPVGFYDLRDAAKSAVPVVSTAFRPITADELAKNPFRVFTSMLAVDDDRFFSKDQQRRLTEFLEARELFSSELLELAQKAAQDNGLEIDSATKLLELSRAAFELSDDPIDKEWYRELDQVSSVAADIGGVTSTHINHLTPRVLDIDDLYHRMEARGITMIDEVQGPPAWDGPDVLLRQTSFRALAEKRTFRNQDGELEEGELRVRFGEVEQRGIALTPKGRDLYDQMVAEVDRRLAADTSGRVRTDVAREVWEELLPNNEAELAAEGLAFFTYRLNEQAWENTQNKRTSYKLSELIHKGIVIPEPIVYEDFLPRSAAGIFQSNLSGKGAKDEELSGSFYNMEVLSDLIGRKIADPNDLYGQQEESSRRKLEQAMGITITT